MKLILDTSVIIDFLRQDNKTNTWLYSLSLEKHQFATSIITHTELFAGKSVWEKQAARSELETIFSGIKLIPLTQSISTTAGKIRAQHQVDLIDAIIAATAIEQNLPLATLNPKDFSPLKPLKILNKNHFN